MTNKPSHRILISGYSKGNRKLLNLVPFFLLLIVSLWGCEAPRVIEQDPDRVSGNWQFEIQGPPEREDQSFKFRMRLDMVDGKITGVAIPMGEDNQFPSTDIRGVFIGDRIEFDRFLRPDPKRIHGLHAGKFSGAVSEDGSKMAGEALLDPHYNYWRDWNAMRITE